MEFKQVAVSAIRANRRQPRSHFDDVQLAELAESIAAVGLLQPVLLRPLQGEYELIAGERRLRAVQKLGWTKVPALVKQTDDSEMLREALLENLQRADLNPLEEAASFQQLLNDLGCSHEELASRLGKSRSAVTNTIRLLRLPANVQRKVAAGVISPGHARALLALSSPEEIEHLATRVVAEGISVRSLEEMVALGSSAPGATTKPRRSRSRELPAAASELADGLADRLDTRVAVTVGRTKGRLTIEFGGVDDLHRIAELLLSNALG